MIKTFYETGDFVAKHKAEKWLEESGYSYGSSQMNCPIGILKGDFCISKWRNMSSKERGQLHGMMTSNDFRKGPVLVEILNIHFI